MRERFVNWLSKKAKEDPKVILIVGDVGFNYVEKFAKDFPNQFLNCGVMEQTMIGVAAGMADEGWKPYVYSMINFVLFRPFEQVRNDLGYGKRNVKLFGVKGSEAYKFLGHSHNIIEDEDEMITYPIPNLEFYRPESAEELEQVLDLEFSRKGPAYTRL